MGKPLQGLEKLAIKIFFLLKIKGVCAKKSKLDQSFFVVKKIDDVIPIIMFTSKISLDVWLFVGKDELIECHYLDHTLQLIERLVSVSFFRGRTCQHRVFFQFKLFASGNFFESVKVFLPCSEEHPLTQS